MNEYLFATVLSYGVVETASRCECVCEVNETVGTTGKGVCVCLVTLHGSLGF